MKPGNFKWTAALLLTFSASINWAAEPALKVGDPAPKLRTGRWMDTLARVLFLKGKRDMAVELQEKAVQLAKGRRKEQFQQTLDSYKEGKAPKSY